MTTTAEGTFQITDWKEETYAEREGGRVLAQADVEQSFAGDLEGTGSVRWQMAYRDDGTADWLGMQLIEAVLDGRSGSFVLRSSGTFDGERAAGEWTVVSGSGTGELRGLTGRGSMDAPMGLEATYSLDYDL